MSTLDSRLKRIEQRIEPPAHPLLDDPAVRQFAEDVAEVLPWGEHMLDCIARRDAAGLQAHLDRWVDLQRSLERGRADDPEGFAYLCDAGRRACARLLADPSTSFAHYAARHPRYRAIVLGEDEW